MTSTSTSLYSPSSRAARMDERLNQGMPVHLSKLTPLTFLERSAAVYADKAAVIYRDREQSYAEFRRRVHRLAGALRRAGIQPGDRVVVLGPGPIGILCAALARLRGAEVGLVGLDRDRKRLDIAEKSYGCVLIIGDPTEWANARDGLGADGVIDATGFSGSLKTAMEIVRPAGWITKVGWGPHPFNHSLDPLVQKNIRLQGSFSHNWPIWERVIQLLSTGQLNIDPVIGGQWKLERWQEAFETMHSGEIVKAVLINS